MAADEKNTNADLVELAKQGDREAFGELVRRHRAQVYGYARQIARESYMAEDIVQEALLRAFLHLGNLADASRFGPWLRRIIQNQAYTLLAHRSNTHEASFTEWLPQKDWGRLDHVLNHLSRGNDAALSWEEEPEERLMRKELLGTIIHLLKCLSRREREIFEAHFFKQLPPPEIARLFETTPANVYQVISRSRQKLVQENVRFQIGQYLQERKDWGRMGKKILRHPDAYTGTNNSWTSAAGGMFGLLEYTDAGLSFAEVMGLTGLAFRLNVVNKDVHIAGPTMYNFAEIFSNGLKNIGYTSRVIYNNLISDQMPVNFNLLPEAEKMDKARLKRKAHITLPKAVDFVHQAIDQGKSVVSWDLVLPEFGLIYGYDDNKKVFDVRDNQGNDTQVGFDRLGRGTVQDLFVLTVGEKTEVCRKPMLQAALSTIIDHYRGKEEPEPGCTNGLAAYDAWIQALRSEHVEPIGNAYTVAVTHDARKFASQFLEQLLDDPILTNEEKGWIKEAKEHYDAVCEPLAELKRMFPFPDGGDPNDAVQAERAIRQLSSAKESEGKAVLLLEKLKVSLDSRVEDAHVHR